MPVRVIVPGRPIPAVRMTRKGKFSSPRAQLYLAYKDIVGWAARPYFPQPLTGEIKVTVRVYIAGKRFGDADNYLKMSLDSCNKIAWHDDKQVADARVIRYGCKKGEERLELVIEPMKEGAHEYADDG